MAFQLDAWGEAKPPSRSTMDVEEGRPIVLDTGSWRIRAGWGGESDPRAVFRPLAARPKGRVEGQAVIGDGGPGLDASVGSAKSPFEADVLCGGDPQEMVFDYALDRLGLGAHPVQHPMVVTETLANPALSRGRTCEQLFELYGVPEVAFGWDAAFAAIANGFGESSSFLLFRSGHASSHVAPMIRGHVREDLAFRVSVGGHHVTEYLSSLLAAEHSTFASMGYRAYFAAEEMKHALCYVADSYDDEVTRYSGQGADERMRGVKLPEDMVQPVGSGRQKQQGEEATATNNDHDSSKAGKGNVERLREMARKRREDKIQSQREEVERLEKQLEAMQEGNEQFPEGGEEGVEIAIHAAKCSLARLEGRPDEEVFPLADKGDDEMPSEAWRKERQRQRSERQSMKSKRRREERRKQGREQAEREEEEEEERMRRDPEAYAKELEGLKKEVQDELRRIQERKERRGDEQRKRLRLMAEASGFEDADFGQRDEDWDVYRRMELPRKSGKAEGDEADLKAELARLDARLERCGDFLDASSARIATSSQLILTTHRVRAPEALFQPSLLGSRQANLTESCFHAFRRQLWAPSMFPQGAFLCGGSSAFPGFFDRLKADLPSSLPHGSELAITCSYDPFLDPFRGASMIAFHSPGNKEHGGLCSVSKPMTKREYQESGPDRADGTGVITQYFSAPS